MDEPILSLVDIMSGYHVRFHREIRDRILLDWPGLLSFDDFLRSVL